MTAAVTTGAQPYRYVGGDYLAANPHWHAGDSPWKAEQVLETLDGWRPTTVCEVGCGAGLILRELHDRLPHTTFVGFEISPAALRLAAEHQRDGLEFRLQDAATTDEHFARHRAPLSRRGCRASVRPVAKNDAPRVDPPAGHRAHIDGRQS